MGDFSEHSLIQRVTRAVRRGARFLRRRSDERGFVAFHKTSVPSGGGTINLHLKNPSSDTTIDVEKFLISSQFKGEYAIYDAFSSTPTGGSSQTIDNLKMDSSGGPPDSGEMAVNSDVAFTASGTHFTEVLPSGGAGANTIGGAGGGTEPLIEPGREIVIELQNDSSSVALGSIGVVYTEVKQGYA